MNYQLLALDLDGTLTNSDKVITPPTIEALLDIQQQGKKVVLASGRPSMGVLPLARQLSLSRYGGYVLSFNGGRIIDCQKESLIYNKHLPDGVAAPLFHIVKKYSGVDILAYDDNRILSGIKPNRFTDLEARINQIEIESTKDFLLEIPEKNNKFLITGEPDQIARIQNEIKEYFRSYLSVYCSDLFFLEIMPYGIDKAHSLLRLLTSLGLSADEMVCCGDGYNDLSMIETAGLGVAMANAQPAVKEKADYITSSNDEDGVLQVINQFLR